MQEVGVTALAVFLNRRVHALFSDESSLVLQEGLHMATHFDSCLRPFHFSLPNAPHGSLIRQKARLLLHLLNLSLQDYVYIPGLDSSQQVLLPAPLDRVLFPIHSQVTLSPEGYQVASQCGHARLQVNNTLAVVKVEYLQRVGEQRGRHLHLQVAKQFHVDDMPLGWRVAVCLVYMRVEEMLQGGDLLREEPYRDMAFRWMEEHSFYQAGKTLLSVVGQPHVPPLELQQDCQQYGFSLEGLTPAVALPSLLSPDQHYRYEREETGISRPDRILLNYDSSRLSRLFFQDYTLFNTQPLCILHDQKVTFPTTPSLWRTHHPDGSVSSHNQSCMTDFSLFNMIQMATLVINRNTMHLHYLSKQHVEEEEQEQEREVAIEDGCVEKVRITQQKGMKQVKVYFKDQTVVSLRQGRGEGEARLAGEDGQLWSESMPWDCLDSFRRGWRNHAQPHIRHALALWEQAFLPEEQLQQEQMQQQQVQESVSRQVQANSRMLYLLNR